jgi:hypothetical protein
MRVPVPSESVAAVSRRLGWQMGAVRAAHRDGSRGHGEGEHGGAAEWRSDGQRRESRGLRSRRQSHARRREGPMAQVECGDTARWLLLGRKRYGYFLIVFETESV